MRTLYTRLCTIGLLTFIAARSFHHLRFIGSLQIELNDTNKMEAISGTGQSKHAVFI